MAADQAIVPEVLRDPWQVVAVGHAVLAEVEDARLPMQTQDAEQVLDVDTLVEIAVAVAGGLGSELRL